MYHSSVITYKCYHLNSRIRSKLTGPKSGQSEQSGPWLVGGVSCSGFQTTFFSIYIMRSQIWKITQTPVTKLTVQTFFLNCYFARKVK